MKKKSNPRFNYNQSVKQNAENMGVAPSTLYNRLKKKGIDRKKDKVEAIIADIKEALEANPDASQKAIAQITHHGVATVNKYWKIAKGIETIEEKPKPFAWKEKEADPNGKKLFSELLKGVDGVIRYADQVDISGFHDFLFGKTETPMFFVGNGGTKGHYGAMLYGMNKSVGLCITPYLLSSLSDDTIRNSRFLLMCGKGKSMDGDYAAQKLLELNPDNTALFTFNPDPKENKVSQRFQDKSKVFLFPHDMDGFISSQKKFFAHALLYRAFTEKSLKDFHVDLSPDKCYQYQLNNSTEKITPPNKINHFLVLYGGWSEPVAMDFESVLAETGMASAQLTDYRNFCHGRFIFASNHTRHKAKEHRLEDSDAAMVFLITPRERRIVEYLRKIAIPSKMPILIVETEYDSPLATIDLLVKTNVFLADLGEKGYGINPNSPPNYSSIQKRDPINKVLFKSEFNRFGEMRLDEGKKPAIGKVKASKKPKETTLGTSQKDEEYEETILDGIKFKLYKFFDYRPQNIVQFHSKAYLENQVMSNHYNCIVKFRGVEFYGFEMMYHSMKFAEHPEILKEVMAASSAVRAKKKSMQYRNLYFNGVFGERWFRVYALSQLFKYLSVKEYRDRLRELRGRTLVECPNGHGEKAEASQNLDTNIFHGRNYSGRFTMLIRDMMLPLEDEAIAKKEVELGRKLTNEEQEKVILEVCDRVRDKYENLPQVKADTDAVIDYIKDPKNGISLTRKKLKPYTKPVIDWSSKAIIVDFDNCLFDTSVDDAIRKRKRKRGEKKLDIETDVFPLIQQYKLYEGWRELLTWAKKNKVKIGVLCNASGKLVEKAMQYFKLPYDFVVGYQPYVDYPNPIRGNMILNKLKIREKQVVFIGTTKDAEKQARCNQFKFIGGKWGANEVGDLKVPMIDSPKDAIEIIKELPIKK